MGVLDGQTYEDQRVFEGNLCNLFTVLMSVFDSDVKSQLDCNTNFRKLEENLDSIGLLCIIKKLVYTRGASNLIIRHNKAMVHMNLMNLYKGKFQDIQELIQAMRKICEKLDLKFGKCVDDMKAILRNY